jgi:hypothetical protein
VAEQVGLVAAGLLQGVREDRQPGTIKGAGGQLPLVVSGLSQGRHLGRSPGRVERDGAEGVANYVTK